VLHEPATDIQFQPLQHASDEIISDLEALAPAEPAVANHAPAGAPESLNVAPATVPALAPAAMTLRLSSVALDTLINATGEVAVGRARIENDLLNLKAALKELSENVLRMRREVRELQYQLYPTSQFRIEFHATMKTVKNLMTGKDVQIDRDTPWCCNPASETYWSM
jgi:chemotaxis protein histidine kinase CheA